MTPPDEQRLADALRGLTEGQPFEPDPELIKRRAHDRRARARTRRALVGTGLVVAAVLAVATVVPHLTGRTTDAAAPPAPAPADPLSALAATLATQPPGPGDATLTRIASNSNGQSITLYTDDGNYYSGLTETDLAAHVRAHVPETVDELVREAAAARLAATGELATARQRMAAADLVGASPPDPARVDQEIWENTSTLFADAAGDNRLRSGILRLWAGLPGVTVTRTSTGAERTLTVTSGAPEAPTGVLSDDRDTWVVDATTGIPVSFSSTVTSAPPGQTAGYAATFRLSRVSAADIADARF
jgi:hypothetical protein